MDPNGIRCFECGYNDYGDPTQRCPNEGPDEDHPTIAIFVEPCPSGATVADWYAGTADQKCGADDHEYKSGNHVTMMEDYLQ
jgi:hypothetical protein